MVKTWIPEETNIPGWVWPVVSAGFGILICVLAGVDVFGLLEVDLSAPEVGNVLSGILVSRGASFTHDLWENLKNLEP